MTTTTGFFFQHFRQNSTSPKLPKFQNAAQFFAKTQDFCSKLKFPATQVPFCRFFSHVNNIKLHFTSAKAGFFVKLISTFIQIVKTQAQNPKTQHQNFKTQPENFKTQNLKLKTQFSGNSSCLLRRIIVEKKA